MKIIFVFLFTYIFGTICAQQKDDVGFVGAKVDNKQNIEIDILPVYEFRSNVFLKMTVISLLANNNNGIITLCPVGAGYSILNTNVIKLYALSEIYIFSAKRFLDPEPAWDRTNLSLNLCLGNVIKLNCDAGYRFDVRLKELFKPRHRGAYYSFGIEVGLYNRYSKEFTKTLSISKKITKEPDQVTISEIQYYLNSKEKKRDSIDVKRAAYKLYTNLVLKKGKAEEFESFLATVPSSDMYHQEVYEKYDYLEWNNAKLEHTAKSYKNYLQKCPEGKHKAEAVSEIDHLTFDVASKSNNIILLNVYIENCESGLLLGKYVTQAQLNLEQLLINNELNDTVTIDLVQNLSDLANPFSLSELYNECTQEPPNKNQNTLFSISGSSTGKSSGEASQIVNSGGVFISQKVKRRQDQSDSSTYVSTVVGNNVRVYHMKGELSILDLYSGFDGKESEPQPVFTLKKPNKDNVDGVGFSEVYIYSENKVDKSFVKLRGKWYSAD